MSDDKLVIEKVNDVYIKVHCDSGVALELNEYFTFSVPGARHMPMFKNKVWDGKIRLFNAMARTLYFGLKSHVEQFATERNYEVEYLDGNDFATHSLSIYEAKQFITDLNIPFEVRDYQLDAFIHCARNKRALMLSPTASGKSLIIYLISRYIKQKALIIVPTTSLVHQMASDFVSYGGDPDSIHKIFSGREKITDCQTVVTTWQSIYKLPRQWFDQFGLVIGDEAHLFKAKSLTSVLSKLVKCEYKLGFTGTLDGTQTHKLVLEGLFGPVKQVTTTNKLIEDKVLADINIKCIVLSHDEQTRQQLKTSLYQDEIDFIISYSKRNKFIANLALSLTGNTLLLFKNIDHGKTLHQLVGNKKQTELFYVDGGVDGEIREDVRAQIEVAENGIIVASLGTFSTGINIRNLHNIIFASPSKSRIKTLQSIGRGLRKSNTKSDAVLYDIADDISYKSRKNFTLLHFGERIKMYSEEKFKYKIYNVKI